jgi:hypothetical protein
METAPQEIQPTQEKKAYVYKLQCNDGCYYYGSTKNKINYRLNNHKQDSKKYPERKIYQHINKIGWDCVDIEIVKEVVFTTQSELKREENHFIKQAKINHDEYCLNENHSKLTPDERKEMMKDYYEKNKEDILERLHTYREENKEIINQKKSEYRKTNNKHREYNKQYKKEHQEELQEARKKHYEANKEEILEKCKEYVEANKEAVTKYKKQWTEENKEYLQEKSKQYREEHKEHIQQNGKKYYEKNYDVVRAKNKQYYENNKEKIIEQQRQKNIYKDCEQVQCECGGKYVTYHKKRHMESKKHLKFNSVYI